VSTKFRLLAEADTPTVVGKAWWNEALKLAAGGDQRRNLLIGVGVAAGGMFLLPTAAATVAIGTAVVNDLVGPDTTKRNALELQKTYGWSFGVVDESRTLSFSGAPPDPAAATRFASLAEDLAPSQPAHRSAYVPTLFQSLTEQPTGHTVTEDRAASPFVPLADVMVPMRTAEMAAAEVDARWLRALLHGRTAGIAVIVDLPGPESVAFAAELADIFDPVFLFDNWPHPRGVVPAHRTLAAAVALQPRFVERRAVRAASAPPLFVLDRHRLNPYTDDKNQFDNRSLARVPAASWFKTRGILRVFYVAPNHVTVLESDDLTDDFLAMVGGGVDVRALQLGDFYSAANTDEARATFNARYDFPSTPPPPPATPTPASTWRPAPRSSAYSGVAGTGRTRPAGFGEVPVVLGAGGVILGALYYRNGSWNRASSSSSSYGGG
jgi:hypothetical protein